MSAAGESRLCIVIATCGEGQRIAELEAEIEDLQRQALALGAEPTADFAPWVLLGVKIDQCPHSAEGDECGRDARFPSNHGLAESSPTWLVHVGYRSKTGDRLLVVSSTGFDPHRTLDRFRTIEPFCAISMA
jgi:hypothetical protein